MAVGDLLHFGNDVLRFAVHGVIGTELLAALQTAVADVAADDGFSTLELAGLCNDGADGAGAQNEHHIVLAHACTAGAVLADGQRLDQSGILPGDAVVDLVDVRLFDAPVFTPAAVGAAAAHQNVLADIAAAMLALVALAAANHVVNHDVVAHLDVFAVCANLGDQTNILVAGDQRVAGVGVLALINMDVAAADTSSHHLDLDFVVLRFRDLSLAHLKVERLGDPTLFHNSRPPCW